MQMPEEEAFAVLVKIMQDYRMRDMFKPSMAELGLCMYQLENLVKVLLLDIREMGVETCVFLGISTRFGCSFSSARVSHKHVCELVVFDAIRDDTFATAGLPNHGRIPF